MYKSNYEVEILVNGSKVREYEKDGKIFVEGKQGQEYSIRVKNNGYRRILAVVSVDGLSVLDGKDASYDSRGYIIDSYSSVTIDGWRKNENEVARFYFSDPGESYRKRKENGNNLGVIGVAVFREKDIKYWFDGMDVFRSKGFRVNLDHSFNVPDQFSSHITNQITNLSNNAFCCSTDNTNGQINQDLGTGWGIIKESRVTITNFEREDDPDSLFRIFYNTRENLKKMGIDLDKRPVYVNEPQAFPAQGWCEPPKK